MGEPSEDEYLTGLDLSGHCALDQADYLSSPDQADTQPYSQPETDDR